MKKLIYLVPVAVMFGTPWVHKLSYENLLAANIGLSSGDAHSYACVLSVVAFFVSVGIVISD